MFLNFSKADTNFNTSLVENKSSSKNSYYNVLPNCMKERIIVVDLADQDWFTKALNQAENIVDKPYVPSEKALHMFDQKISMKFVIDNFYI